MKYILFSFLLISGLSVSAQKDTSKLLAWTSSSGPAYIGFSEGKASVMMNMEDSSLRISGDSMAVIKLLWKRLYEATDRESKLWRMYGKSQDALVRLANDWKRANEQLKKDLEKLKVKNP
jgi:hypothetical protein